MYSLTVIVRKKYIDKKTITERKITFFVTSECYFILHFKIYLSQGSFGIPAWLLDVKSLFK